MGFLVGIARNAHGGPKLTDGDVADLKLRLRYPEYLNGQEEKAEVEAIFRDTGFDYDFAFPGAQFELPNGFWLDLIVKAVDAGAVAAGGAVGLGLTKAAWTVITGSLHRFGRIFKRGQVDVQAPDRPIVSYQLPERDEFDRAVDAMEADYELNVEDVYTVRGWSADGSHWEVTWRHTQSERGRKP